MTSHRLLLLSLSLLIVFVMALSWNQWRRYRQALIRREPPRTSEPLVEGETPDLIISPETTYITEPLTKDGLPDYEAYVWNKYGKGVTPENNAVVPIWRAVGPSDIPEKIRGELFQQLGMEALPVAGDYYIPTDDTNFIASGVAWLLPLWGFRDVPGNRPGDDATAKAIDDVEPQERQMAERVFGSLLDMADEHPWRPEDFPLLCQWIRDNRRPLHLAHVASNRARFYPGYAFAERPSSPRSLNEVGFQAVDLARGLAFRAVWHVGKEHFHEAQQDILAIYRLARLVLRGPKSTDVFGAAGNLDRRACLANTVLAADPDTPIAVLRESLRQLRRLSRWHASTDIMDEGERLIALNCLLELHQHPGDPTRLASFGKALSEYLSDASALDINILMRETNRTYDRVARAMRLPDREAQAAALQAINTTLLPQDPLVVADIRTTSGRTARSQMIARMLHRLLDQDIQLCLGGEKVCNMRLNLTTIAMALAVYRAEHGAYPDALAQLVPDLLDAVSPDLFTGKPLRYERRGDGYMLYSVAADGNDNGGSNWQGTIVNGDWAMEADHQRGWEGHDLVIRVPMAPLEASWLWPSSQEMVE